MHTEHIAENNGVINFADQWYQRTTQLYVLVRTHNPTIKGSINPSINSIYVCSDIQDCIQKLTVVLRCPPIIFPDTIRSISFSSLELQQPLVYSPHLETLRLNSIAYTDKLHIKAPTIQLHIVDCWGLEYEIEFNSSIYILSLVRSPLTSTTPSNIPLNISRLEYAMTAPFELKPSQLSKTLLEYKSNQKLIYEGNLIDYGYSHRRIGSDNYYIHDTPISVLQFTLHCLMHDNHFSTTGWNDRLTAKFSDLTNYFRYKNTTNLDRVRKYLIQLNMIFLCRKNRIPHDLRRHLFSFLI